jgi:hypothetical protein
VRSPSQAVKLEDIEGEMRGGGGNAQPSGPGHSPALPPNLRQHPPDQTALPPQGMMHPGMFPMGMGPMPGFPGMPPMMGRPPMPMMGPPVAMAPGLGMGGGPPRPQVLSFAAVDAQLLYAAPSHLVCTISGYRQYVCRAHM